MSHLLAALLAVAPCHDVCHFSQGTPLWLEKVSQVWVRQCETTAGKETCLAKRLDLDGHVQVQQPMPGIWDDDFEQAELACSPVTRVEQQDAWPAPFAPYVLKLDYRGLAMKLSLSGSTLTCAAPGRAAESHALGCVPTALQVRLASTPRRSLVVVTATCKADRGQRDVVTLCQAPGVAP